MNTSKIESELRECAYFVENAELVDLSELPSQIISIADEVGDNNFAHYLDKINEQKDEMERVISKMDDAINDITSEMG